MNEFMRKTDEILPSVIRFRRFLHTIPELAGTEVKTSEAIRSALKELPLEVRKPYLGTDVTAILRGSRPGPNITLRADMDALPIAEETGVSYPSLHPGVMHACGHDGHTAMLYGAAVLLSSIRETLSGTVRFVFQPGEEVKSMARELVAAGVLEDEPKADFAGAVHGWPGLEKGKISTRCGAVMASSGHFFLKIIGKGGHGGTPELANNPISAAAEMIRRFQELPEKFRKPDDPVVLSVCSIHSGFSSNVIPATADVSGTIRFLYPENGDRIVKAFREIVENVAENRGVRFELDCRVPYRTTFTSESGAELARYAAEHYAEGFLPMKKTPMQAEDFCYFLEKVPGFYAHLGMGEHASLHSRFFDFDDAVLRPGMLFLAGTAKAFLSGEFRKNKYPHI